ncbi:MAG: LysR family transcriptional regulator [Lachnospiraceae bacterium]|nr:LysR family transcriptional regulator [Lachnospiraceae bacterium]
MDLQQLKYFLAASRFCNFTRAAEELFISRQAVAQSVRQLEDELQAPLFNRDKNSLHLTPLGEVFSREAEKIVAGFQAFEHSMKGAAASRINSLQVAVGAGILLHLTTDVFTRFSDRFPDILLSVSEMDNQNMLRSLRDGSADLCLIGTTARFLKSFQSVRIVQNGLCICCHKKNPLAKKEVLTIEDLKGQPIVGHGSGYDLHRFYVEKCREAGFQPAFSIISTDPQIAIRLVHENRSVCFGISDMIRAAKADPGSPVHVLPLRLPEADEWGIYAVTRSDILPNIPRQLFLEHLIDSQKQPPVMPSSISP